MSKTSTATSPPREGEPAGTRKWEMGMCGEVAKFSRLRQLAVFVCLFVCLAAVLSYWGISHGKSESLFPGEKPAATESRYHPTVHTGWSSVFLVYQTLTWHFVF